jgi:serine/threonine protein kinase
MGVMAYPLAIDPTPIPRHTSGMKETIPTIQQKVAPIWVKTEVTPNVPGYEVLKLLGQGGMGQVYQARHLKLQRIVALKLVTSSNNDHALARFEQEVQAIAKLRHPNIAQIYENGTVDGRPYYAMEYVAGGTLSDRLKASPLKPDEAARLVVKLARAMQHAHEQSILHRDLKPSNVLLEASHSTLSSEGRGQHGLEPKIADFGLAKKLDDNDSKLTRTGDVFGSPSYMSPEQASGVMKFTPAVDVYALGAILYECLTGRPPFLGPEPMLTIMMVLSNDPVPPRQVQTKLPLDLDTICLKCLEKQPKKRYTSAAELADDLERYLEGKPILARPIGKVERAVKWAKRRPWQAAAVGLAAVILIGSIVGLLLLNGAYRKAWQANDVSDKSFVISRDTVRDLLTQYTDELSLVPNMEKLTLEANHKVVLLFEQLHALRPDDNQTALEYQTHMERYVQLLAHSKMYDEALAIAKRAETLVKEKRNKRTTDHDWRMAELRHVISMGWLYRQQLKREQAIPYDTKALAMLNGLKREQPDNIKLLKHSNDLLQNGIADNIGILTTMPASSEKQMLIDKIIDLYRQVVDNNKRAFQLEASTEHAALLVSSQKSLATILIVTDNHVEADKLYRTILESLPNLKLPERERASFMVQANIDRSDLARQQQNWTTAQDFLQQAQLTNQKLRAAYPEDALYLHNDFMLRFKNATLEYDQKKPTQAIEALQNTILAIDQAIARNPSHYPLKDLRTSMQQYLDNYNKQSGRSTPNSGK